MRTVLCSSRLTKSFATFSFAFETKLNILGTKLAGKWVSHGSTVPPIPTPMRYGSTNDAMPIPLIDIL